MKTMIRFDGRAHMHEELMPKDDADEAHRKILLAFCENRQHMSNEDAEEVREHLRLMRMTSVFIPETKSNNGTL